LWILDRATGTATQFTSDPTAEYSPVWSPDGRSIVYSSNRSGSLELYRRDVTGEQGEETRLVAAGTDPVAQSWSPDGRFLAYVVFDPQTHLDVWILPMAGDPTPRPFLRSPFSERQPQISPDGRWLAYVSDESGREEVYVQAFPTSGPTSRVSVNGGADPRWRRDGKELFFVAEDRQLNAVSVDAGATFAHGLPVPLFDTVAPAHWYAARNLYDVSRDGSFLFMSPVEDDRSSAFTIVIDWIAALPTHAQRSK
jgi:Tol biopolymer transport system component